MKIIPIVAARMDSSRLPGKPLLPLNGVPLIRYVIQRARRIQGVSDVVLATTERSVDDPLECYAQQIGVEVYRGSLDDVAGRFLNCAKQFGADFFVRINGDSPFLDPALIGRGAALCATAGVDFVTNLIGRTFPYGVSVEIVRTSVFDNMCRMASDRGDREHVTAYLYRHLDQFRVESIISSRPELTSARLVVDTQEDIVLLEKVIARLGSASDLATFEQVAEVFLGIRGELI